MIINLRAVAVSTSALLLVGGVAAAYVNATSVSGGGTVSTDAASLPLDLSVDQVVDPIGQGTVMVDVVAYNPTDQRVVLPAGSLPAPQLVVFKKPGTPGTCPSGSFTVGAPTVYTGTPVAPGDSEVVARFPVTFNFLAVPQNACIEASLRFTFPPVTIPLP